MRSRWLRWLLLVVLVVVIAWTYGLQSGGTGGTADPPQRDGATQQSGAPQRAGTYSLADLPEQARATLALIDRGGPYPYRQDNTVFANRERLLPVRPSGYYHEFTVVTPGSDDRGARRLIRGDGGEIYYTSDHYASFHLVERSRS